MASVGSGMLLSAVGALLFANLFSDRTLPLSPGFIARRLLALLVFMPFFLYEAVVAGINVAYHAFRPSLRLRPGVVRVYPGLGNITATTILASLITLTPGTLALDYDEEEDAMFIHWIDMSTDDPEEIDRTVIQTMRDWVRRLTT